MKRFFIVMLISLFCGAAAAQDYTPTVNWPYVNPDFYDGVLRQMGNKLSKARFNVHLGQGALHILTDGEIAEAAITDVLSVTISDEEFTNVGGKMMKVLAQSEKGFVVEERLADYSAVIRDEGGAYGGSNANAAKGFSYDENYGNYSYLITNNYEDLLSQKEYGEELPVNVQRYIVINGLPTLAIRKNVAAMDGIDKKAFSEFLKVEKINWKDPQDVLKVIDFIVK